MRHVNSNYYIAIADKIDKIFSNLVADLSDVSRRYIIDSVLTARYRSATFELHVNRIVG